jgi:hypothetical protein
MYRFLSRAVEVAEEPGIPSSIKQVYDKVLAPRANAFCKAQEAVTEAEGEAAAARRAVGDMLVEVDGPYRETRSVVLAFFPDKKLPDTLKAQPTDTDTLNAVTALLSVVQSYANEEWAAELSAGRFGTLAPKAIATLKASIAAQKALSAARQERADAHKPAYDKLVAFRRVVRDALGASSAQYRRLRVRQTAANPVEDTEEAAPESGMIPSANEGTTAPAGGSTPVKIA